MDEGTVWWMDLLTLNVIGNPVHWPWTVKGNQSDDLIDIGNCHLSTKPAHTIRLQLKTPIVLASFNNLKVGSSSSGASDTRKLVKPSLLRIWLSASEITVRVFEAKEIHFQSQLLDRIFRILCGKNAVLCG